MANKMRRLPAKEKNIKDITREDFRVSILGIVVDKNKKDYSIMVDDGTSRAVVSFADPELFSMAKEGGRHRIIGKVGFDEKEKPMINGELIQDMSKLDFDLYRQVNEILERVQ